MAEEVRHIFGIFAFFHGRLRLIAVLFYLFHGAEADGVVVPERVTAVMGRNVTLACRVDVSTNLSLTQSSWERKLPSGTVTLAVFNPQYGTSVAQEYSKRVHFLQPSVQDVSVVLEGVSFADIGTYTCKVVTFELGNMQASTIMDVIVEPKVYVSPGSLSLTDGDGETLVATCTAEKGRPAAEILWESDLPGQMTEAKQTEPDGTTTTLVHYVWAPTRDALGRALSCVVRHPALSSEFRIPYRLNVFFPPEITVLGNKRWWFVGEEHLKLDCGADANPPAYFYLWTRLDAAMPAGVDTSNGSLVFTRPLEQSDSGQYRCEVHNDVGQRFKDVNISIIDPPPTTELPRTTKTFPPGASITITAPIKQQAKFTSPSGAPPPDSSLGTVVGSAVGGILVLVVLLVLAGLLYVRQRRTFRGDYYTKHYICPSDMQKKSQLDVLQPHELQDVYGEDSGSGSQDLKPKQEGDIIYSDYPNDHKDMEGWGDDLSLHRESTYYSDHHNHHNVNPSGPPLHNGSSYSQDVAYDNGTMADSDYVSHVDGSVISRREWYV